MVTTINGALGHNRRAPGEERYREARFERHPWERITQSREDRYPVTLWIGIKALVVAVTLPDVDPDDLLLTVRGASLTLQGPSPTGNFSKDIDLPYPVEIPPIRVRDGKDTLYILLQRK
jgi:HSP20 family molecular chaperone IbpA